MTISVWLGVSMVMPSGIGKVTGCEKPRVRFRVLPCTCARNPTPTSSSLRSAWTTDTPRVSGTLSDPLAPLMVTDSGDTVAVTPFGSSTGALAILDMLVSLASGHDAQDFAALADR